MDEFASRQYPVKEHMGFQRRMWVVERVGWAVLAGITLVALTGVFGNGWLSGATADNGAVALDYERFARTSRPQRFSFRFPPGTNGERRLQLNHAFQKNFEITSIQPHPLRSEAGDNGLRLTFAMQAKGGAVTMWAHARGYGVSRNEARVDDAGPLPFSIMIYP